MNFDQILATVLENRTQSRLCPEVWEDDEIRPEICDSLCEIAEDFIQEYEIPKDAVKDLTLTGSLANFTWTPASDLDLHLIVDFDEFDSDREFAADYLKLAKSLWNSNHEIKICGYEVEIYPQDADESHYSMGVYSLWDKNWLVQPDPNGVDSPDQRKVDQKAEKYIDQIESIEERLREGDFELSQQIDALKDKIKEMRKSGLQSQGEGSLENWVFKTLRNQGHLDKLSDLEQEAYDKAMSITHCNRDTS